MSDSGRVLVIDNGSYKCRVGYNDSETPQIDFRNILVKLRRDKRRETANSANIENIYQIGDEVDVDSMRLLVKNQFDRNVVTHPLYQEHVFDYMFWRLANEETPNMWQPPIILMTEPLTNPNYCRQNMNELLFECYGVPGLAYGIDSLFSWHHHKVETNTIDTFNSALIISIGYHNTHVIPVLNGKIQLDKVRRLNVGGFHMLTYLLRLLQMKYPAHCNAITITRIENILHNYGKVAFDYMSTLRQWDKEEYYNENVQRIQLPYVSPTNVTTLSSEERLKKRKEMAKRLIEANQKRMKEKREDDSVPATTVARPQRPSKSSQFQPPPNIQLEDWLQEIKSKQVALIEKKSERAKKRQEMVKRHTLASQERMRIISLLASNEKGIDEFGKDDKDWDVYKQISHDNESDSETDNERLLEYENILKYHQVPLNSHEDDNESTAELYQLHVGVECIRAPELLFQPSMIGISETGLGELIEFVFRLFPEDQQQILAENVYITGACSQIPGLEERLFKELQEMRPFESKIRLSKSQNPSYNSWLGARDFANAEDFHNYVTTKADYDEHGSDYFKEYSTSNRYFPTNKNQQ